MGKGRLNRKKSKNSVIGFYSKTNSSFKKSFLFGLLVLILIITNLFDISYKSDIFGSLVALYLFLFLLIFPEDSLNLGNIFLTGLLIFFTIVMMFAWLSGGNIPYTNIKADNSAVVSLFTVILTIATIINVVTYKQSIGFSRLTELDIYLNPILCVEIENTGNYPARGIKLRTKIIDKVKNKGWLKRRIKDIYFSPEYEKHYLSSKDRYAERLFSDYLEKRFNLKTDSQKNLCTSKKKKVFRIRLQVEYHSDTNFKSPLPIIKEYEVEVDSRGTTRREVKPSPE